MPDLRDAEYLQVALVSRLHAWGVQAHGEALAAGELPAPSTPVLRISTPDEVWAHVTLSFVSVTPLAGALTVEFGFTTEWDEEHTLGARFQQGQLLELCGSVLAP